MNYRISNRLVERILAGRRIDDVRIIDTHVHSGHWGLMHICSGSCEDMLKAMDKVGIDVAVINGILNPDYKEEYGVIAEHIKRYPDRFVGIAGVNPFYQDEITDELTRCFDDFGFKGIKLHELVTQQPFSYGYEPRMLEPVLQFAQTRRCPILFHGLITESMIRTYPEVSFICAHGPANLEFSREMAKYDNYYVDTAYTTILPGVVEILIDILGSTRILFGSDMPTASSYIRLAQVISADIDDSQVERILGLNAAKLYSLTTR